MDTKTEKTVCGESTKTYTVEVKTVTYLEVEAENRDEAIEKACGMAWEYDADEISGVITESGAAVIVEMDYKGYYKRFALTWEEFIDDFGFTPGQEESATLRPLVHIWYEEVQIGEEEWNRFFSDMAYGLPESDIENGNLAYIDFNEMHSKDLYEEIKKVAKDEDVANEWKFQE